MKTSSSRNYRDLKVWQKAMEFVEGVYRSTRGFPEEEKYGLKSQLRRAAVSVPSNVAEGQSRGGKEFRRFIDIAYGSLLEAETQIEISRRLQFLSELESKALMEQCSEIGKMLNGLKNSLNQSGH